MNKFRKQTNYNLNDLVGKGKKRLPSCLRINELGTIIDQKKDPKRRGEQFMLSKLKAGVEEEKILAYCYLSVISFTKIRNAKILETFKQDPANQFIVERANILIERFLTA